MLTFGKFFVDVPCHLECQLFSSGSCRGECRLNSYLFCNPSAEVVVVVCNLVLLFVLIKQSGMTGLSGNATSIILFSRSMGRFTSGSVIWSLGELG